MKRPHQRLSMPPRFIALATLLVTVSLVLSGSALGEIYKMQIRPQWSADNSHFWYRNDLAKGAREFVLVDLQKGTRQAAFDHPRLAKALSEAGLGEVVASRLPVDQLTFYLPKNIVTLRAKGKYFQWDRQEHALTKIEKPAATPKKPPASDKGSDSKPGQQVKNYRPSRDLSPDGKWRAYIHEHNVFVRATSGDQQIQLSQDGKNNDSYQAPYWAPNSNNLVAFACSQARSEKSTCSNRHPRAGAAPSFTRVATRCPATSSPRMN